jgi:hypothetical protein
VAELDLNRLRTAEGQEHEETKVTFGDPPEVFVFPHYLEWDWRVPEMLSDRNYRGAFRLLLGEDDYERFNRHRPTVGDLRSLIAALTAGAANLGDMLAPPEKTERKADGRADRP